MFCVYYVTAAPERSTESGSEEAGTVVSDKKIL